MEEKLKHKQGYIDFIDNLRETRKNKLRSRYACGNILLGVPIFKFKNKLKCKRMVNNLKLINFSEFQETNNSVDIAMKSAAGLKPKKLMLEEVGPDPRRKIFIWTSDFRLC